MHHFTKTFTSFLIVVLSTFTSFSQTTIWAEDFDGNGAATSNWLLATLTSTIGLQGALGNVWYVSDQEDGNAAGVCGSAGNGDQSLHVGSSPAVAGDIGAAYEVGCNPGCFFCDVFAVCIFSEANIRSQSQDISTVGETNLTLTFNYIEGGEAADDDAFVEFSIDGGLTWTTLVNTAKTNPAPCAPQGIWTAFSAALPVSAENIPNLRIAFHWQNDTDGNGVDPSFAVDDVEITTPTPLPVELIDFSVVPTDRDVHISWSTISEQNCEAFIIERTIDNSEWTIIDKIRGAGTSQSLLNYTTSDSDPLNGTSYYRLIQVDLDGTRSTSDLKKIEFGYLGPQLELFPNPAQDKLTIRSASIDDQTTFNITNTLGEIQTVPFSIVNGSYILNTSSLPNGLYLLFGSTHTEISKFVIAH